MKKTILINLLSPLLALSIGSVSYASEQCEISSPIVFSDLGWDSNTFHIALASYIIQNGYGCNTQTSSLDELASIKKMANGDVDVTMEVWVDNVVREWKNSLSDNSIQDLGKNFDAVQSWYIPKYLVEGNSAPAKGLASVFDLPKYKHVFKESESNDIKFYNCVEGWSCEVVNSKKLGAYNLNDHFTNFKPKSADSFDKDLNLKLRLKKPVVFYYWEPSWIMNRHSENLIKLKEPDYNKTTWDEFDSQAAPKQATAYPTADVRIGVSTRFANKAPKITSFLKRYQTSSESVSLALNYMFTAKASPEEAAIYYLKRNKSTWHQWLPENIVAEIEKKIHE